MGLRRGSVADIDKALRGLRELRAAVDPADREAAEAIMRRINFLLDRRNACTPTHA